MKRVKRTQSEQMGHAQMVDFLHGMRAVSEASAQNEINKGFYDPLDYNASEKIALMHSELSEVLEAMRDGNPKSEKIPTFSSVEEELSDAIIRIAGFAYHAGFDLGAAVLAKMDYNRDRPHKHGRQF